MQLWFFILVGLFTHVYAINDQAGFRGSIGSTSTNSYATTSQNKKYDPTKNSLSYGLGLGYRYQSGFMFELDYLSTRNTFQSSVISSLCASGSCSYTACVTSGNSNLCTSTNMTVAGTTTGSSVVITDPSTVSTAATSTTSTSTTGSLTTTTTTTTGVSSSSTTANSGYLMTGSLLANAIYQFSPQTTLNPYIGYGYGYDNANAGIGLTTTPTNTTVTNSSYASTDGSTTVSSPTITYAQSVADNWISTSTEKYNHPAHQYILGTEIRLDIHNTIDIRIVKKYVDVPDVTTLYSTLGYPIPTVGQLTTTNGVTSTIVTPTPAIITAFQIGLLYYG